MKELNKQIADLLEMAALSAEEKERLYSEKVLFPFSKESSILTYLASIGVLDFRQYRKMVEDYSKRNRYISLYELAPRTFGQSWGEKYVLGLVPEFVEANKENVAAVYPAFNEENQ